MNLNPIEPSIHEFWRNVGIIVDSRQEYIHIHSRRPLETISSGIHGGGIGYRTDFLNFHVAKTYDCSKPKEDIVCRLRSIVTSVETATGLMTAATIQDAGWVSVLRECWSILVCVTAGFSNAARVTDTRELRSGVGTINIMVIVHGRMTHDALVGAVITSTEAKSAALADLGIRTEQGTIATGTTTDAIVIGSTQNTSEFIEYTGLATQFGRDLSKAVYDAVIASGRRYLTYHKSMV